MSGLGPGSELGGFVIEAAAGRGGMGVVYRARQLRPDRLVALKVVAPELSDDADFRRRFEGESQVAAQIEHAHVIPVYAIGEENGVLYIAMRYIVGTDLSALITATGRLDPRRAATIIDQVATRARRRPRAGPRPPRRQAVERPDRDRQRRRPRLPDRLRARPPHHRQRGHHRLGRARRDDRLHRAGAGPRRARRRAHRRLLARLHDVPGADRERPVPERQRPREAVRAQHAAAAVGAGARAGDLARARRGGRPRDGQGPRAALPVGGRLRARGGRGGQRRRSRRPPSAASPRGAAAPGHRDRDPRAAAASDRNPGVASLRRPAARRPWPRRSRAGAGRCSPGSRRRSSPWPSCW